MTDAAPPPFCQGADWKPRASTKVPGTCGACGADLVGRLRWFCPTPRGTRAYGGDQAVTCRDRYVWNHIWGEARQTRIARDKGTCQRCGGGARVFVRAWGLQPGRITWTAAEVNHIDPRNGAGYGNGCWNHQDNLETLCHACHVETTKQQGRERRRGASPQYAMEV